MKQVVNIDKARQRLQVPPDADRAFMELIGEIMIELLKDLDLGLDFPLNK